MLPVVQFFELDELIEFVCPPERTFFVGEIRRSLGLDSSGMMRRYVIELSVRAVTNGVVASFTVQVGRYTSISQPDEKEKLIKMAEEWAWGLIGFLRNTVSPVTIYRGTIGLAGEQLLVADLDLELLGLAENDRPVG
jgi:hypothetical protein